MPASHPVPRKAVRLIAASLLPPIQSGRGCCTGRGAIEAASYWKCVPSKVTSSSSHSLTIRSIISSATAPLPRGSRPVARHSGAFSAPTPKAGSSRPLLR